MSKQALPDSKKPLSTAAKAKTAVRQPASAVQRTAQSPGPLTPEHAVQLQKSVGNTAVSRLVRQQTTGNGQRSPNRLPIQCKMTLNAVGDKYEQEADAVVKEVMQKLNAPQNEAAAGVPAAPPTQAQRQTEEEETIAQRIQRQEIDEEEMMLKRVQRQEIPEEEMQLQRQEAEEEELQLQRQELEEEELPEMAMAQRQEAPEEEEMQLQRQELDEEKMQLQRQELEQEDPEQMTMAQRQPQDFTHGGPVDGHIEAQINQSRGGGRPMEDSIRQPMEQAFGADFSDVRIHTDGRAHDLNEAIQARAFTTDKEVFFKEGEYNPRSAIGQELLAHELTHVAQQSGIVQRQVGAPIVWGIRSLIEKHLNRNKHNVLPKGSLTEKSPGSDIYIDESGREWRRVSKEESKYHQPKGHEKSSNHYPNEKFVHRVGLGSFEAIKKPDGTYETTGPLQGTYNYVDPSGIFIQVKNALIEKSKEFANDPEGILNNVIDNVKERIDELAANPIQALNNAAENTIENVADIGRDLGHLITDIIPHEISDDYTEYDQKSTQYKEQGEKSLQVAPHQDFTGGTVDSSVEVQINQTRGGGRPTAPSVNFESSRALKQQNSTMYTKLGGGDYIVNKGETLWKIAEKTYGHGKYWHNIYQTNKERVRAQGDLIYVGTQLRLPLVNIPIGTKDNTDFSSFSKEQDPAENKGVMDVPQSTTQQPASEVAIPQMKYSLEGEHVDFPPIPVKRGVWFPKLRLNGEFVIHSGPQTPLSIDQESFEIEANQKVKEFISSLKWKYKPPAEISISSNLSTEVHSTGFSIDKLFPPTFTWSSEATAFSEKIDIWNVSGSMGYSLTAEFIPDTDLDPRGIEVWLEEHFEEIVRDLILSLALAAGTAALISIIIVGGKLIIVPALIGAGVVIATS